MASLTFLNIHNIHVMRESLKKVKDLCVHGAASGVGWFTAVDATRCDTIMSSLISSDVLASGL